MQRRFTEAGMHPFAGYLFLVLVFSFFSIYLFYLTTSAPFIYLVIALVLPVNFSAKKRNDFLKTIFWGNRYIKIRMLENTLVAFPFVVFLCVYGYFMVAAAFVALTTLLCFVTFVPLRGYVMPTPFYRYPFEFIVGFRKSFMVLPLLYAVCVVAVCVNNFNLGLASVLGIFAMVCSYYFTPEEDYYVWSFALTARAFINKKIKTALVLSTCYILPPVLLLGVFYPFYLNALLLLLCVVAGYAFLIAVIGAKYLAYPNSIHIGQGIILGLCVYFPPLLLVAIPYFLSEANKNLKTFLA